MFSRKNESLFVIVGRCPFVFFLKLTWLVLRDKKKSSSNEYVSSASPSHDSLLINIDVALSPIDR